VKLPQQLSCLYQN